MSAIRKPPVSQVLLIQLVILLVLSVAAQLYNGTISAYSVFLGGLISVIPNAYFTFKVYRYSGARSTERLVRSAYLGELIKLVLTGTGFALVFTQINPENLHVAGLFIGFVLVQVAGLVSLAYLLRH